MREARTIGGRCVIVAMLLLPACPGFQEKPGPLIGSAKQYTRLGREQIFVQENGKGQPGPAVLLIHGYGSAHDAWARIIPKLSERYRVLAPDLPGFGRSDKYPGDYSPIGLAKKLTALLDKRGVGDVHLVAHSWGSSIALAIALNAPKRVRSITLMGAWVFEEQLPAFVRWARLPVVGELLYALIFDQRLDDRLALAFHDPEPFTHPAVVDAVRRQLGRPGAKRAALQAARQQRYTDLQARYSAVKTPTLLVWGKQDRVSALPFAHRLDRTLPRSRLVLIDHCGHIPALERPRRVLQDLLPFLATHHGRSTLPTSTPTVGGGMR